MRMLQKMSAAAIAVLLFATLLPETQVLAAETTEAVVLAQDNTDEETAVSDEDAVVDSALTEEDKAQISAENYTLYTEAKQAGAEELAEEQAAAALEEEEQAAAAKAAEEQQAAAEAAAGSYSGRKLTRSAGTVIGPSGKEVYYNMNMSRVVSALQSKGYSGSYWVRSDGVKMFGDYVMVAANYGVHPYGSLVQTSLGTAIVCDTGTFASSYPTCLDVAVTW